jgi:hypothetical protein
VQVALYGRVVRVPLAGGGLEGGVLGRSAPFDPRGLGADPILWHLHGAEQEAGRQHVRLYWTAQEGVLSEVGTLAAGENQVLDMVMPSTQGAVCAAP